MIKVIVHVTKAIIAIAASMLFFSCGFERVDGTGNVITQPRSVGEGFTKISASNSIEVYIAQGDKASVIVEADGNLQEHIKTKVTGGVLTIESDVEIGNADAKKVTVTLPKVESVESSAGCIVKSTTVLKGDNIKVSSSSGSSLEVSVESNTINCEASSGSSLKIGGRAKKLKSNSSSGSSVDAKALVATDVDADASSGSTTIVNPVESLKASASSGSSVNYVKTPEKLSKDESSGGSVSQD
ncbi:MAG: head GIN domain-containing protein [Bacteroidota bacterium]